MHLAPDGIQAPLLRLRSHARVRRPEISRDSRPLILLHVEVVRRVVSLVCIRSKTRVRQVLREVFRLTAGVPPRNI
jgi:hypothetical protein